jgi:hypothetical protein
MKLLTKQNLEVLIIDGLTVIGLFLVGEIDLPVTIYTPIALLAICYAMANKTVPRNILQLFYAFSLIGVVFSISGLLFLLYDNSFVAAIAGIIIGFVFAMSKENSRGTISIALNKLYNHKSRIIILPVVFNLFVLGTESLFTYKMSPGYAMIFMMGTYIPVRLLFLFKPGAKWYHLFFMAIAGYLFVSTMMDKIYNSPTATVWKGIKNELGDQLVVLENDTINGVVIEATIAQSRSALYDVSTRTYVFVVDQDSINQWKIEWKQTDALNFDTPNYRKLKNAVMRNLE